MKVVLQRVAHAQVVVEYEVVGSVGAGLLALVGLGHDDSHNDMEWMANKMVNLRIFPDDEGKMNRSVLDMGGGILAVSQFTLLADCRKGRRPSFVQAMHPDQANPMFDEFVSMLKAHGLPVSTGKFGAEMQVSLLNQGPVTILLDSEVIHS